MGQGGICDLLESEEGRKRDSRENVSRRNSLPLPTSNSEVDVTALADQALENLAHFVGNNNVIYYNLISRKRDGVDGFGQIQTYFLFLSYILLERLLSCCARFTV